MDMKLKGIVLLLMIFSIGCSNYRAISRTPDWTHNHERYLISPYDNEDTFEKNPVIVRYAPILIQYTLDRSPKDFLADFNYDSDNKTVNNQDHVAGENFRATLYYAIVETASHYYLTYLSYHIADTWVGDVCGSLFYWFGGHHENDGENLQLVVEKGRHGHPDELVIMAFQHHTKTTFLVHPKLKMHDPNAGYDTIGTKSKYSMSGSHPVFVLEPGKHAIYINDDQISRCSGDRNAYVLMTFSPAPNLGTPGDRWERGERSTYHYGLKPIKKTLWEPYIKHTAIGDTGIMDGGINITLERGDKMVAYKNIPRFFNSDEWSIVGFKKDAGILPFAFGEGRLFFDPAHYYAEKFQITDVTFPNMRWVTCYLYNPYLPDSYRACE